jgi:hypothetical protein
MCVCVCDECMWWCTRKIKVLRDKTPCAWTNLVDCVWNVMTHAQRPDFVFRQNGRVHLNRQGRQLSRLLAGELCTSACWVCTARASLCSAVTWRLLVTHSILLFPLHFSFRTSPCAITFETQSNKLQTKKPSLQYLLTMCADPKSHIKYCRFQDT